MFEVAMTRMYAPLGTVALLNVYVAASELIESS